METTCFRFQIIINHWMFSFSIRFLLSLPFLSFGMSVSSPFYWYNWIYLTTPEILESIIQFLSHFMPFFSCVPSTHLDLFAVPWLLQHKRFLQNKSLWPSITENKRISCYEFLCSAFDSAVYEKNLSRALEISTCRVIPYFKFYLDKLRVALSSSKTFSFTSGSIEEICAKVCMQLMSNTPARAALFSNIIRQFHQKKFSSI